MAQPPDDSEMTMQPPKSERSQSALARMRVLPPIAATADTLTSADDTCVAPQASPPSPTGAAPNTITDENVDLFLRKKSALIKYIMELPDLVQNAEKYLHLCKSLTHGTLKRVNRSYSNRLRVHSLFVESGFFHFVIKYWHSLNLQDPMDWTQASATSKAAVLFSMLSPIWNGTDTGDNEYLRKFDKILRPFYLQILDNPVLYTFVKSGSQAAIIKSLIAALHNLVQKYPSGSASLRDSGGMNIISRYITHPDLSTKTLAILVLSYISTEDEQRSLMITEEQVEYLVNVLQSCLAGTNPRHYSRTYGFQADEVLEGLNRMAVADASKAAIVRCGALPLYGQLLSDDCEPTEQAEACKGLWMLAFNAENKQLITREQQCMEGLRMLTSSNNDKVKRAAEGALWVIEGESKRAQTTLANAVSAGASTSEHATGHIMISYNWGVKQDVIKVKDRLKAAGYKVWIDIEQMSGSTLDAMASSIEKASLVLIFFTEQYKMSPSCRSEAEYCYKMQKPFIPIRMQQKYLADGWLGMILGTKLFYDFTKHDLWESTFENLCRGIGQLLKRELVRGPESYSTAEVSSVPYYPIAGHRACADNPDGTASGRMAASDWTEDDVREWLCKHGLQGSCDRLAGFAGAHVVELQRALTAAPLYFYGILKNELALSLKDAMTFTKMIRELT